MLSTYWNYKTGMLSALWRGLMLLVVNLRFGWKAAGGVMIAEMIFRIITCGFFGAWTEKLATMTPKWRGTLITAAVIPITATVMEYFVLEWKGTPDLKGSMIASIVSTAFASLFNLYAQRNGVMTAGSGSFAEDLKKMPVLVWDLVTGKAF